MPYATVVSALLGSMLPGQLAFLGLETASGVLAIVLGFGALIFVHELGHFLAAKWAGVRVEVFSLGFGPRLFGVERGGTDYRISALPLGGYVKMLGQDDSDPGVERTDDPDDFRNKSVFKRMVILIAGVVMNTIFAVVAFVAAFGVGVDFIAPEIGYVEPNRPAYKAKVVGDATGQLQGFQPGDQVLSINGSRVLAWEDIQTAAALAGGPCLIDIARPTSSGVPLKLTLEATPDRGEGESIPHLGVHASSVVSDFAEDSPAKDKGIKPKDEIIDVAVVGSENVPRSPTLAPMDVATENPGRLLRLKVRRREFDEDGNPLPKPPLLFEVEVTPASQPIYGIGVTFVPEARVVKVTNDSPAKGVLEPADTLVSLDGRELTTLNVLEAVKAVGESKGTAPVELVWKRTEKNQETEHRAKIQLQKKPNDEGWLLGINFGAQKVAAVAAASPAAEAGIEPGDLITGFKTEKLAGLIWKGYVANDRPNMLRKIATDLGDKQPFLVIFEKPGPTKRELSAKVTAKPVPGEALGDLKIAFGGRPIIFRRGALGACGLGVNRTIMMFKQLVNTIRSLFSNEVSTRELGGPIQIATITYNIARAYGMGKLLYFLAILSVNLAVLNILPIPVLDGGHLFLLSIEKLKGRPLSDDVLRYVQYGGLFFVIGLMLYVTFNDIRRWFE